ncbi:hypothetical protein [Nocardia sp. NPDC004722]
MTYPPGVGGHSNVPGQEPNPDWWDQPAQQTGEAGPVDQGWQQTQVNWTAQQGYSQDPGYGQQPGYPQAAMQAQPPGFAPGAGYGQPQGFPPPGPPKSKTGVIVGVVVAAIVVLAIAVGGIVLVSKGDNSSPVAAPTTTETALTTSAPVTTRTTAPATSKAAPAGKPFSYTEYGQDWNFKMGDVALQATYVSGRDYSTCGPIDKTGKIAGLGCRIASEMAWKAESGEVMLTQLVLTMSDAGKATAANGKFADTDIDLPDGSYIADFETGKWKAAVQGQYVVYTAVTGTASVDEATVDKYLKWRSTDTVGALAFR